MIRRLDDIPVYAARPCEIEALLYNLWRRARQHLGCSLRIELQGMPDMAMLLEDEAWVLVDQRQFDLPVLAWLAFQDKGRDSLHKPVSCTLNYYHFMASQLRARALVVMAEILEQRLSGDSETTSS